MNIKRFYPKEIKKEAASPSRIYVNSFLKENLKNLVLLSDSEIKVLDVGCGSGYVREIFQDLGYRISYTGLDVKKHSKFDKFSGEFINSKIEDFQSDKKVDLVLSMSALEHIEDNQKAISRIGELLAPNGVQIHSIPAKASYPLYLGHGYRRYNVSSIKKLFGDDVTVYKIGGMFSFMVHFFLITIPKKIFKTDRVMITNFYYFLVKISSKLDRFVPAPTVFYIIISPSIKEGWPKFSIIERIYYKLNQLALYYYLKIVPNSTKKYFIFYHPPRSAGTSIKYLMKKQGYSNRILGLSHYCNVRNTKFRNKNIVRFATIRNPFSWYVSLYNSKIKTANKKKFGYYSQIKENSFQNFFDDLVLFKNGIEGIKKWHYPWKRKSAPYEIAQKYNPEYGWCANNFVHYFYPEQNSIKIIRAKDLQEETNKLFEGTDIKLDLTKKITNVDSQKNYMDYYTPEMIAEIKKRDALVLKYYE